MKTTVKVEWKDLKFGAKDTTVTLVIKGDPTDEQILTLTKLKAAGTGYATLCSAQMDIDDYDDEELEENRVTLDDIEDEEELPFTPEDDGDELPE